MGFGNAMKAANGLNFGRVEGPDFQGAYLVAEDMKHVDDRFLFVGGTLREDYPFTCDDILLAKIIANGESWIKWYLFFKNGKMAIITSPASYTVADSQRGSGISMAPIERFFGSFFVESDLKQSGIVLEFKRCPNCGVIIDDQMAFCGECGSKLK